MATLPDPKFTQRTIEKALKDLPPLPMVVVKVLEESQRNNVSASSLEAIIKSDQALTSKALRVVNSAYYGLSGQVSSLGQACVILGVQQIRNLVLSMSAMSSMQPRTQRQREAMEMFWLHSFGTAAAAQAIGRRKRMTSADIDSLFVGGLLHDIGRLFLFCNFTQAYDEVLLQSEEHSETIEASELRLLGISHGSIGEQMARAWKLPDLLCEMIGLHEGPFTQEANPMLYPVHLGDSITKYLYHGPDHVDQRQYDPIAMDWLNFSAEEIAAVEEETAEKVASAQVSYGLIAA